VRAAPQRQVRRAVGQRQRQQDGLQQQRDCARAALLGQLADVEAIVTRLRRSVWMEGDLSRFEPRTLDLRAADLRRCQHSREVLGSQPRIAPPGPDAGQADGLTRHDREGQRGSQNLSATLSL
jgi:hypothetical protein